MSTDHARDRSGRARHESAVWVVEERAAAAYTNRALGALRASGCTGAMVWCYTDYVPTIWADPPPDAAVHERSFGQWRAHGSPQPAVEAFAGAGGVAVSDGYEWIDIEPDVFYTVPGVHLDRLYDRFRTNEVATSP